MQWCSQYTIQLLFYYENTTLIKPKLEEEFNSQQGIDNNTSGIILIAILSECRTNTYFTSGQHTYRERNVFYAH